MSYPTKIIIGYKNTFILDAIKCFLAEDLTVEHVGTYRIEQLTPDIPEDLFTSDVLILEPGKVDFHLYTLLEQLRSAKQSIRVILLANIDSCSTVSKLLRIGVRAFLQLNCTTRELFLRALRNIQINKTFYCSAVTEKLLDEYQEANHTSQSLLSDREVQVLRLLAQEMNIAEMADELFLSTSTVKTHRYNLMKKLDATGSLSALRRSIELGILTHEDMPFCSHCDCSHTQPVECCS